MTTTPRTAGAYTFYATTEYYKKLVQDIADAPSGSRILLATMAFDPRNPTIAMLTSALDATAQRGCHITLEIDAYVFLVDEDKRPGPLFYHKRMPQKLSGIFADIQAVITTLRKSGVTVVITNPPTRPFTSPFAGRSHIKASIINDIVYLGGCNLSAMHSDVMVRRQHKPTADWLYNLLDQRSKLSASLEAFGRQDIVHGVDEKTEIIVDVGVKKQSAIYQRALQVIDNAQDWLVITCQYFPNSLTAKHLKQAQARGVKVYPIFNHYSAHSNLHAYLQHAVTSRERLRMPVSFFTGELKPGANYLHAKILATESEAMIGSHNYVTAGVNFGTAEIALHVQNSDFAKAATHSILAETGLLNAIDLPL